MDALATGGSSPRFGRVASNPLDPRPTGGSRLNLELRRAPVVLGLIEEGRRAIRRGGSEIAPMKKVALEV